MNWPEAIVTSILIIIGAPLLFLFMCGTLQAISDLYWRIKNDITFNNIMNDMKKLAKEEQKRKSKSRRK